MTTTTLDRLDTSVTLLADLVAVLRDLAVPADRVHSLSVEHWSAGPSVSLHISGDSESARPIVDRIGDHYGLPADDAKTGNYTRGVHLGATPVLVFCGRADKPAA